MANGGYIDLILEPGQHSFEIKSLVFGVPGRSMEQLVLELETGKEYYLEFDQRLRDHDAVFFIDLALSAALKVGSAGHSVSRSFMPLTKEVAMPDLQKTRKLKKKETD